MAYLLTFILTICMTYLLTLFLRYVLSIRLAFIQTRLLTYIRRKNTGHMFWHLLTLKVWQFPWPVFSHFFDIYLRVLLIIDNPVDSLQWQLIETLQHHDVSCIANMRWQCVCVTTPALPAFSRTRSTRCSPMRSRRVVTFFAASVSVGPRHVSTWMPVLSLRSLVALRPGNQC